MLQNYHHQQLQALTKTFGSREPHRSSEPFHNIYELRISTIPVNAHTHIHIFIYYYHPTLKVCYQYITDNSKIYSADHQTVISAPVMPNKQNNWAEVSYKNRFCNYRAHKACILMEIQMTRLPILLLETTFYFLVSQNMPILTFSCLNLVRILISLNVRWQYV